MVEKEREVAGVKKDLENKGLVVVLVVLAVVIVGLITWMGIVYFNRSTKVNQSWNCGEKDTLYDIGVCMEDAYEGGDDVGKIVSMYEEAVNTAKGNGNYKLASDLLIQRTSSLALMGECSEAMSLLKRSDFSSYNSDNLLRIYSFAVGTSASCDDKESFDYWSALLTKVNEEIIDEEF